MNAATIHEALSAANIQLHRYTPGTHRTACHRCDKGPHDDALAVTIHSADDVVWNCHRCHWADGWRASRREYSPLKRPAKRKHVFHSKAKHVSDLSDHGRKIWAEAKPIAANNPAGRWLTNRKCWSSNLNDLRYHRSVWHAGANRTFAAMLGLITDIRTGARLSLHQTLLTEDGQKAAGDKSRKYLHGCPSAGGVIRLSPDDEVTTGLVIGEGIETCATALLGISPVWCCMDAGHRAYAAVKARWEAAGRAVLGIESPVGNDLNDFVRAA